MDLDNTILFTIGKQYILDYDLDYLEALSILASNPEDWIGKYIYLKLTAPVILECMDKIKYF